MPLVSLMNYPSDQVRIYVGGLSKVCRMYGCRTGRNKPLSARTPEPLLRVLVGLSGLREGLDKQGNVS